MSAPWRTMKPATSRAGKPSARHSVVIARARPLGEPCLVVSASFGVVGRRIAGRIDRRAVLEDPLQPLEIGLGIGGGKLCDLPHGRFGRRQIDLGPQKPVARRQALECGAALVGPRTQSQHELRLRVVRRRAGLPRRKNEQPVAGPRVGSRDFGVQIRIGDDRSLRGRGLPGNDAYRTARPTAPATAPDRWEPAHRSARRTSIPKTCPRAPLRRG